MSEQTRILYYALWIAHPVIQAGIAAAMLRYKLQRKFKYFFAYIIAQILTFAVVFSTYWYSYHAYVRLYWFGNAVSAVLGFLVIHEVFLDVFQPFHTLRDLGTVLFKWAGLVMLLVAGVVSISSDAREIAPWMQAITTAQRCVRIVQVGMVLFLMVFAKFLGVSRKHHSFGIALGFGGFATVELALIASWAGNHLGNLAMSFINMSAYNVSLLIWLSYALAKSPVRDATAILLQSQRWEESLTSIHHPAAQNSLIPMFEGMVDRALSRTQMNSAPLSNSAEVTPAPETVVVR